MNKKDYSLSPVKPITSENSLIDKLEKKHIQNYISYASKNYLSFNQMKILSIETCKT